LDKAISSTFMIIVSVVAAVLVFKGVYPALISGRDAIVNMNDRVDQRLKSQIEVIHSTGSGSNAYAWVKNIGSLRIAAVTRCDVFFGPEGDYARIPHEDEAAGSPYWTYLVEGSATEWTPTETLKISIIYGSLLSGRYFVKVIIPNGVSDEDYFSVG